MKRNFGIGIVTGVLASVTVIGLGISALAAGRNITIDDGIRVVINQEAFTPRDSKGAEVPVFVYNGTTYVPVRPLSEKLGFQVSYDSASRTAYVQASIATGGVTTPPGGEAGAAHIGEAKAKEAALKHSGVAAADATFVKAVLAYEDGKTVYEVEFYTNGKEYDYEIDAVNGSVLTWDSDAEGYAPAPAPTGTTGYIGEARAKEIALAKAPGSTVVKCELDMENGTARYELELRNGYTEYECELDATTGAILKWSQD